MYWSGMQIVLLSAHIIQMRGKKEDENRQGLTF